MVRCGEALLQVGTNVHFIMSALRANVLSLIEFVTFAIKHTYVLFYFGNRILSSYKIRASDLRRVFYRPSVGR